MHSIDESELENELERLTKRVADLEIANRKLSKQVARLQKNTSAVDASNNQNANFSHLDEHERAKRDIFLDRYDRELYLGAHVYILTTGAHTNRSRRGEVTGFDQHRNRVFILDNCGVTQERAPKNLRLEDN